MSLFESHAFLEPRHTLVPAIVPVARPDHLIAQHRFGHPDVRIGCRESECGWHDPDNRERAGTKLYCGPMAPGSAEKWVRHSRSLMTTLRLAWRWSSSISSRPSSAGVPSTPKKFPVT